MYVTVLFLVLLPAGVLSLINNRQPVANYVIPIYEEEIALVHCISYFAETIFDGFSCQDCSLKHARYCCCKEVLYNMLPLRLRCTSFRIEWDKDDPNIPFIDVSVVKRSGGPINGRNTSNEDNRTVAFSDDLFYCNQKSNISHLTAGSHIGLGWTIIPAAEHSRSMNPVVTTQEPMNTQVNLFLSPNPIDHYNDNARHKETQFSSYYAHDDFEDLWISEDIKVELMQHNSTFTCNETEYILPRGSSCMTPSRRAIFVMTNCGVVERVFIVIGVIILLVVAYIVFNVLIWLWDFVWHFNSSKHKDKELLL